ncbi:hypothetical protein HF086_010657 [Spodoptera exigua]|uniref:Uncharacterized protein n=1 Tax=Spodoptera exigua TaxID=7107 RepID=A0A922MI40_SPOEX|nr:hypothetical protein HF086_010657 [Spodoptera exigua]
MDVGEGGGPKPPAPKKHKLKDLDDGGGGKESDFLPYLKPGYKRLYPENSSNLEFKVYVQGEKIGNKSPTFLNHIFVNEVKGVVAIRRINANKIAVVFKQYNTANNFLCNSSFLEKYNFKAFIPAADIERTGIIRYVPTNISNKELYSKLESEYEIIAVRRFTKKVGQERVPLNTYTTLQTTFYEDVQTVAISLSTELGDLSILTVYCPPHSGHTRLNKLRNIIKELPKPVFISGDFNAHHIAFGCVSTKGRGQQLYDISDELDLCLLNDGSFTTNNRPNCNPSAIDITFTSAVLAPLCDWTVHDDSMGSYHFPTITNLTLAVNKYQTNPPIEKFLYKKADWVKYCEISETLFNDINVDTENPLKSYNTFCNRLSSLKLLCIPKYTKTSSYRSRPPAPWWNEKCEQSVIKSYQALKYYRSNPTMDNYIIYKKLDALKKRTISEEKKNGWRNLCESFNRNTPISKIWNYIKMFKGRKTHNKSLSDEFVLPLLDKLSDNGSDGIVDVDICTGAFDNVQPGILIKILSDLGIPGKFCKWIYSFLNERILYVKHNNILHGPRQVSKGTMQGATLSPLLYNIYTSQICKYVNMDNVNILQFADDLVVYSVHNDIDLAIANINNALSQLYHYYNNKLRLNINPNKSNVMFITKDLPSLSVLYNDKAIPIVSSHKFLGVQIDNKLTFQGHIKYILQNSLKGLNIMRCLAGVSWGADPVTLAILYKAIVRSHFDYSCLAYIDCNYVHRLDIAQNKGLRIISGAMCSTPIRAMEVETGVMPLSIRRYLLAQRFSVKLFAANNNEVLRRILPQYPVVHNVSGVTGAGLHCHIIPDLSQVILEAHFKFSNIIKSSHWACYSTKYKILLFEVSIINTVVSNNEELLNFIHLNSHYYRLYTDGSKVSFMWIPSHKGITGNEIADRAAFDGINCINVSNIVKVPFTDCYALIRENIKHVWKDFWKKDQEKKKKVVRYYSIGLTCETVSSKICDHNIMDSCLGVEQDLDKALSKFKSLNDNSNKLLQNIIDQVEEIRQEITKQSNDTQLTPAQAMLISDLAATVKASTSQMSTDHRELHATVSRVGKSIDRHFIADYASVAPKAESFCNDGLEEVGDAFVSEAKITGVERTCTFALLQRCAAALAEGDPSAALNWAERRAQELQNSPLPFTLHRMQALKVCFGEVDEACGVLRLAPLSPLAGAVLAGARVLPALHDIRAKMTHPHVIAAWSDDELPFEVDLGEDGGGYHSVFACPILRQQASEQNPPMRLLCGHVISRDALNKLAMGAKLKCPYCPMEQSPAEARQIYFS